MIHCQRDKFTLSDDSIYLNCAYMSPLLKSVEEAGITGIMQKRNPLNITAKDFYEKGEEIRKSFANLINCPTPSSIVVIPSVSYGVATVAANVSISAGNNIVVASEQFPSNYYSWKRLADENHATLNMVQSPKNSPHRGKEWNERILEAINNKTKVVAMGNVHWADGTLFDLKAIRKRTKEVGALLIIDGTQSIGALPFNVQEIQPDALICAGYKWLLGPYSIGVAYFGDHFNNGKPIEESWINRLNSEDFAGLVNYEDIYQQGMLRYEVGQHGNFILLPMMHEAIKQINSWGVGNVQQYCTDLVGDILDDLKNSGAIIEDKSYRVSHIFGIRMPKTDKMNGLKLRLEQERIAVSVRGDAIRVAPNVYNTKEEIIKLTAVIKEYL